jgi:cardiolipin synthase
LNIPNFISLARLLIVPIVVWAILDHRMGLAFWLFVGAGISDAVDGFLARRMKCISVVGQYLDPLADKALLMSIYLTLGSEGYLPNWIVILVVSRDVLIIGGAILYHLLTQNLKMAPLYISKVNTLAQILLAGLVLGGHALALDAERPIILAVLLVAATTAASGASYIIAWTAKAASFEEGSH